MSSNRIELDPTDAQRRQTNSTRAPPACNIYLPKLHPIPQLYSSLTLTSSAATSAPSATQYAPLHCKLTQASTSALCTHTHTSPLGRVTRIELLAPPSGNETNYFIFMSCHFWPNYLHFIIQHLPSNNNSTSTLQRSSSSIVIIK